jgi:uncharacterized RDD family membrane protein YckC
MSSSPSIGQALLQDDLLTRGVLSRRLLAWLVDLVVLSLLCGALYVSVFALGFLTLGVGWTLLGGLPFVPAAYYFLSVISPMQATPGQALFGLVVVSNDDLGPPTPAQVLVCVIVYVVTLPAIWVLALVGLVTARRRLLHDLLSGLVVVRARALQAPLTGRAAGWTMRP